MITAQTMYVYQKNVTANLVWHHNCCVYSKFYLTLSGDNMYKAQVQVYGDDKWYDNSLEFKTELEAEEYAKDLFSRWSQAEEWRVIKIN